jgi:predicted NUDIX family phosphoesterase
MNNGQQPIPQVQPVTPYDEHILVVKRAKLFPKGSWQGLRHVNGSEYLTIIDKEKEFLPRSLMESDVTYKQIIPYLIFTHKDTYFLMQRQAQATEQRLKNKYTLGIGGHIRQEDLTSNNIVEWAQREFEEEVDYQGSYTVEPLGILNDDSNPVGQVHVGFVFLLKGDSNIIEVKSELKSGQLLTFADCQPYYDSMETWSQITLDFIRSTR